MVIKKTIATALQILSFFILFCGSTTFILGIAMHIDSASPQAKNGLPIAIFSFTFILPGVILYFIAKKSKKNIELMQSLAGIFISFRRIRLGEAAAKLMMTEQQASKLLAAAVESGLIRGNFDRTTGEFFTEEAEKEAAAIRFCPSCGSPLDRIYLKGETIRCRSCGGLVL